MVRHLGRQFAVAAFDSWADVYLALDALKAHGLELAAASVLAARESQQASAPGNAEIAAEQDRPVKFDLEFCRLPFDSPLHCTAGPLAAALEQRRAEGAATLGDAFAAWLTPNLADDLERQIAAGRILLWFEITEPEHHSIVCGELVRATPHIILICDARF